VRDVRLARPGSPERAIERGPEGWTASACTTRCTVRYEVDLDGLAAAEHDDLGLARRAGDATLSPALAWLIRPEPRRDVPVTVHVRGVDPSRFASGLRRAASDGPWFAFRSLDLDEGSFTAFGPVRRQLVPAAGARLELAIVGNEPLAVDDAALAGWAADQARAVTELFGRFPVPAATLFVVPAAGEAGVLSGKVLSLAGASVALVVGSGTTRDMLAADRVLLHELVHLGFPTFRGEGRWLVEGIATYYEGVLRARTDAATEEELFGRLRARTAASEPRTPTPLAARTDDDGIYWGGALFCLAADVAIRAQSKRTRSLDDAVRAVLARGGDATAVWSLAEVLRVGDEATGTAVLSDMYARHVVGRERIDARGLFAALDDPARLGWARRAVAEASFAGDRL
jgi:hypothetical protein